MKYIMMKQTIGDITRCIPIIFPNHLVHEDVSKAMQLLPQMRTSTPVSAGFIDISNVACYGESETLRLSSQKEEDSLIIETMDYLHGINS